MLWVLCFSSLGSGLVTPGKYSQGTTSYGYASHKNPYEPDLNSKPEGLQSNVIQCHRNSWRNQPQCIILYTMIGILTAIRNVLPLFNLLITATCCWPLAKSTFSIFVFNSSRSKPTSRATFTPPSVQQHLIHNNCVRIIIIIILIFDFGKYLKYWLNFPLLKTRI